MPTNWPTRLKQQRWRLAAFACLTVGLWLALGYFDRVASWISVEAPANAVQGKTYRFRVRLAGPQRDSQLCADLHWAKNRDSDEGFLAGGGSQSLQSSGGTYDFAIPVTPRSNLHFVHVVIYLSPTGQWEDHTFAATTKKIPVQVQSVEMLQIPFPLYELQHAEPPDSSRGAAMRILTGCLWLLAAALVWRRPPRTARGTVTSTTRKVVIAMLLVAAGIWELAHLESSIGTWARNLAHLQDLYYSRAYAQKALIAFCVAAAVVWFFALSRSRQFLLDPQFWFVIYAVLALTNLLSLHIIDQILGFYWHGLIVVHVANFLCATAACISSVLSPKSSAATAHDS